MNTNAAQNSGFTLIELVIVVSLVVLVSTIGIISVVNFTQTQGTGDDIKSVSTELRNAYSKATGVFYPSGCNTVTGYTVLMNKGSKDISLKAEGCANAPEIRQGVLKSTVFSNKYEFTFTSPNGSLTMITPASPPVDVTIESDANASVTKKVTVGGYGVFNIQ